MDETVDREALATELSTPVQAAVGRIDPSVTQAFFFGDTSNSECGIAPPRFHAVAVPGRRQSLIDALARLIVAATQIA